MVIISTLSSNSNELLLPPKIMAMDDKLDPGKDIRSLIYKIIMMIYDNDGGRNIVVELSITMILPMAIRVKI